MSTILTNVGVLVSDAIDWMKAFLVTIVGGTTTVNVPGSGDNGLTTATVDGGSGQPVLILFCIALPLVGLGIGLLRRLIKSRA